MGKPVCLRVRGSAAAKMDTQTKQLRGCPRRGAKRCQESRGRMKKHRSSEKVKVMAVKIVNARHIETKAVADAGRWADGG